MIETLSTLAPHDWLIFWARDSVPSLAWTIFYDICHAFLRDVMMTMAVHELGDCCEDYSPTDKLNLYTAGPAVCNRLRLRRRH